MEQQITRAYLRKILEYKDGELFWKVDRRKTKVGDKAGRKKSNGYCEVRIDGRLHGTHRIIFMMFHGHIPKVVDHIDGNPSNNRIENLREATYAQNMMNSKLPKNNTSGFKGIYFCARTKKWVAQCWTNNKKTKLGYFSDIQDAAKAVSEYRNSNHKEFAREK
jgi:hypothetical protein